MTYSDFYQLSISDPETFWKEQAERIHWHRPFDQVLDYHNPPFAEWFVGGQTNLCYNAVDRWAAQIGDRPALIAVSTETSDRKPLEKTWSFRELQSEVECMAAVMKSLGVSKGDRVLIYMPMVAEAVFTMLACARIGAVHAVVFGGFAANSLSSRIDDAKPKLIVSADAGSRLGTPVPYKHQLDDAINLSGHKLLQVLMVDTRRAEMFLMPGRDHDYETLRSQFQHVQVPVTWMESTDPSYILYTSGTTGKPKGVQRDVGGYAVGLACTMDTVFQGKPGATYFCASDIGWVVGHSYTVYGPLIAGMTTVLYEGVPWRPDAGIWWQIVEKYQVNCMFTSPSAIRALKKHPVEFMKKHDVSSLHTLFLAGEPLDETTSTWAATELGIPVIDNYWQTESGWPILAIAKGIEDTPVRLGSPGVPMMGYQLQILNEVTGDLCGDNEKGVLVIQGPLPPGCLQTIYGDDDRFVSTYWNNFKNKMVYSTFDWGIRDSDGYYFILGRVDDVIKVAGRRLGTREIEEIISSHKNVAEVAVVGVSDQVKGEVPVAFVVPRTSTDTLTEHMEKEIRELVINQLGSIARPARVHLVGLLPKTRSGKILRRAIKAICEGQDPGELATIEDHHALTVIHTSVN